MKRSFPTLVAALIGAGFFAGAAHAQLGPSSMTNGIPTGPVVGGGPPVYSGGKRQAPPPALPGSRTMNSDPAPMDRPPSEMRPTEALFDSINRGDIAAARDALSRGAELNARNVLGLTPIDLSVDLGRNDITFLLLSMRGSDPSPTQTARTTPPKGEAPARQQAARTAPARPLVATAVKPATSPMTRQQYADVPGTPAPQAGFLGFSSTTR
jgi:hypothetical protein